MEKLKKLLVEGERVRVTCYNSGRDFAMDYLSGEEYSEWLSKCKIFINLYCKDEKIKEEAFKIIDAAYGDSISKYERLAGILKALASTPEAIGYKEDKKDKPRKVFVSHCSKNKKISNKFVDLIKLIGASDNQIYYSSYEETGAEYLEDCFDRIEKEFNDNELLVIFMLSREFYQSDVCMAETGATWVLCKNNYIPVILPPYSYNNINGVVRNTQNSLLLDSEDLSIKLERFKTKIEEFLDIKDKVLSPEEWARKKDEFIQYIKDTTKKIEEVEVNIKDISIVKPKIVCKVSVKNNTHKRKKLEVANLSIASTVGCKIEKEIDDWSVNSVVVQPLEDVSFYISIDTVEEIKRNSQIDKVNSSIKIEFYDEE